MSVRERLSGIWLMGTTLLSLFAYTIYFVAQMWLNILHALFLTLAVLQIAALILYLWGSEKLKSWPMKLLYRLLYLSSLFVVPAFTFIFMGLISQYHVTIPDSIPRRVHAGGADPSGGSNRDLQHRHGLRHFSRVF